jgi:hypothetical protein
MFTDFGINILDEFCGGIERVNLLLSPFAFGIYLHMVLSYPIAIKLKKTAKRLAFFYEPSDNAWLSA